MDYPPGQMFFAAEKVQGGKSSWQKIVTKVVDTVRASGIMRSIDDFASAVEALLAGDPDSPTTIRLKDRVTTPLDSGYRDVLLNVTVPGCLLVCELQLHFHDIFALKPMGHRCYEFKRAIAAEAAGERQRAATAQAAGEGQTTATAAEAGGCRFFF